ncbi:MAG: aconitase family protein [Candidatus Zixiibacteriota bacterium]
MTRKKKVPTKAELLQLQKLYKTDEKIGERLGGVPAYLVAYWRRKKAIPKHSLPKFSEIEVRNLWERYGDDEKAGLEIGLSKAAFYNWRRRYGIKEKPAFLKLEQLEFNFPGAKLSAHANSLYGKQTVAQKILARIAGVEKVERGETVEVEPDMAVVHNDIGAVMQLFRKLGPEFVWNPSRIVVSEDCVPSLEKHRSPEADQKAAREFLKRQRIKSIYDFREGFCHQVVMEKGHVLPGQLVLSTDRLAAAYGAMSSLATTITPDQMASVWAESKASIKAPETIRITISGRKGRAVFAKDIFLSILQKLTATGAQGKVVEYGGSVMSQMTMSERFTLSSLAVELGASGAVCPYDAATRRYVTGRAGNNYKPVIPDKNAEYSEMYQVAIDQVVPQLVCPPKSDTVRAVAELDGTQVQLIILGSLTNGRFDDLRVAADILKGKHVSHDCRLVIMPSSRTVYLEALKKGLIRVFIEAGAVVVSSGSFSEIAAAGMLTAGDRCMATTGSDLMTQLSSKGVEVYLCSPATAAASALHATITDPTRFVR